MRFGKSCFANQSNALQSHAVLKRHQCVVRALRIAKQATIGPGIAALVFPQQQFKYETQLMKKKLGA